MNGQSQFAKPGSVMVTGAGGNLGGKAVEALGAAPWCKRIIGTVFGDEAPQFSPAAQAKLTLIRADLSRFDPAWDDAMAGVEGLLHCAAANPVPEATWEEAAISFDMIQALGLAALRHGVKRMVFLSSNHVMGGYKDPPLADRIGPGLLTTTLPPAPGTHWSNGHEMVDSTGYAASKLMGERCMALLAADSAGRLTTVTIRIGWVLRGDNKARDVNFSGTPGGVAAEGEMDAASTTALRWFRAMWLSNRDFTQLIEKSLTADPAAWPGPAILVNGNSRNQNKGWSVEEAERWLGFDPKDDLYAELEKS
ncbi:NAD(P)-dependent oxidoreductase [Acidisoma cellulosilytica]|uniref:NAD(P)-dependent oxidoreductase n=1 Tax=Acidisoma cellulosilyticum TaxID=2802395 RepID=A0A964E3Z1_9PROT|nr:NAD(P)-dependent oxidoreductase [Acidisoma cellulosilyticum]MCB8880906.1 NAD(P)-dependent oxidoreductase [Acidisoma cellulosilyticum]